MWVIFDKLILLFALIAIGQHALLQDLLLAISSCLYFFQKEFPGVGHVAISYFASQVSCVHNSYTFI